MSDEDDVVLAAAATGFNILIIFDRMEEGLVKLWINETLYTVDAVLSPDTTLNTYIRDYVHAKGTKFMCQEGGCGACIVAIKRFNQVTKKQEIVAANSCLIPVFLCHNCNVITVEGIGNKNHGFHKIQSTLAGFSGTQCGYCSPGMVMNMFSLLNSGKNITMEEVENSFGGNICRCTGYRPILDAFKSLASDASVELKKTCVDIEDMMAELKLCPKTNEKCDLICKQNEIYTCESKIKIENNSFYVKLSNDTKWFRVEQLSEIYQIFDTMSEKATYMLMGGNTSHGVYRITEKQDMYIDINGVEELHTYTVKTDSLMVGANMTLTSAIDVFTKVANENPDKFAYLKQLANHIDLIANVPVRNFGTLAGNLSIKYQHREFSSDLFLILEAVRARLVIGHASGSVDEYTLPSYLALPMHKRVIISIKLPAYDSTYIFSSYKIMQRAQNTHAYVNAGFLIKISKSDKYRILEKPTIVFGGIHPDFIHATKTEEYLRDKQLLDIAIVKQACEMLQSETQPDDDPLEASAEYRRSLAVNLLYKFILSLSPDSISTRNRSGGSTLQRPVSTAHQDFQTDKSLWPVNKPIPKLEALIQCSGEAEFVNDMPVHQNELFASFVLSKSGPGTLGSIDTSAIKNIPGVVTFLSAKDIPGKNSFVEYQKVEDEELFASKEIRFAGQAVGVVIAKSQTIANKAANLVVVNVTDRNEPVLDLKEVVESGNKDRITKHAEKNPTKKKTDIKYKLNGTFLIGSQYHYTMETQTCFCVPTEDGIDVYPSSQALTAVQVNVGAALAIPQNAVNVSNKRCGGGYGSKLGRSALVATACAVAANNRKAPVMMVMPLETNMEAVGKRFPMYAKYEVAVDEKGNIQYLNIKTYTERGAIGNDDVAADIISFSTKLYDVETWSYQSHVVRTDIAPNTYARSPEYERGYIKIILVINDSDFDTTGINEKGEVQYLDMETYTDHGAALNEPLFGGIVLHSQSYYETSTWHIVQYDVVTDRVPHTYVRAPGSTEGLALIEYIMEHIAQVTKLDPIAVRLTNLNPRHTAIPIILDDIKKNSDFEKRKEDVEKFNTANRWKKRGITLLMMNYPYSVVINYHSLISIYGADGTVSIAHGGIEVGQGINTKVAQAAAYTLSIDLNMIKIKPASTLIGPNDGPTGGSMASDGVTMATIECCKILLKRLEPIKQKNPGIGWKDLISKAVDANIDLCAEYMHSPTETPSHYDIYGMAVTEVEVDVLTGQQQILRVDLLEDAGRSISPYVDIGQVEGAFVMGLGYWLTEKLIYDIDTGACLTNRTWNYTPPGCKDIPIDFRVYFRRNAPNPDGVLRSKATGEPPLCLSVSSVFAIRNALAAAREDAAGKDEWFDLVRQVAALKMGLTHENVLEINLIYFRKEKAPYAKVLPYIPENVLLSSLTSIDQFNL